jgi:hypothetical protein
MIVVNPEDANHTFDIIPRYYPSEIVLTLYNEVTQLSEVVNQLFIINDGIMTVSFTYTFTEQAKYQIKITDENGVVFRGKLISTSQIPQDYKQTNNLYVYE